MGFMACNCYKRHEKYRTFPKNFCVTEKILTKMNKKTRDKEYRGLLVVMVAGVRVELTTSRL